MISSVNILIELLCLCTALFFLRNDRTPFSILTKCYLGLVVLIELLGFLIAKQFHQSNSWLYNLLIIFEVSYVTYGLFNALKTLSKDAARLGIGTLAVFGASYLVETWYQGFFKFNSITIGIVSIVFVLLCLYYYYLLMQDNDTINLKFHSKFWWVAAVLFYYFGGTMYNLINYLLVRNSQSFSILVYTMLFLNLILYSIWAYSFICRSRQRKLSR